MDYKKLKYTNKLLIHVRLIFKAFRFTPSFFRYFEKQQEQRRSSVLIVVFLLVAIPGNTFLFFGGPIQKPVARHYLPESGSLPIRFQIKE